MPSDPNNRTLVLTVVAVDLVCYSQKSVAEQISLKDHFNQVLLQAIRDIPIADRIILDTGDGVAMGFLGDPEDALYVAMFMHDAINREGADIRSGAHYGKGDSAAIRIGINLGPVKLATGVGGHPNIVGDGINVAERIMGFAEPGQLTASRPFFEVMSRMSDHYATLFEFAGVRTDKQIRSHDVYLVGKSQAAYRHAEQGVLERGAQRISASAGGQTPPMMPPVGSRPSVSASPKSATETRVKAAATMAPQPASKSSGAMPAPPSTQASAPAPVKAAIPPDSASEANERHAALIDFLEDRNKVATTATLLAIAVVILGALLAYRKMSIPVRESAPSTAISAAPDTKPVVEIAPPPGPTAVTDAAIKPPPGALPAKPEKTDTKPQPAPDVGAAPAASATPVVKPVVPAAPIATGPTPAKGTDRPAIEKAALPAESSKAAATSRDSPKGILPDKAGARDDVRKPPPRTGGERDKAPPPAAAAPIVPAYQTPAEAPQPVIVAPTPAPAPKPAPTVDTNAVVVSRSAPPFPVEGIRQGIKEGFVKARLTIDAAGNVSDVSILEVRPIAAFGRETRNTLKSWKFNPGAPARSYEIEITFKP